MQGEASTNERIKRRIIFHTVVFQMQLDFHGIERKWQKFWEIEGIYKFNPETEKKIFSIDTPPPTVSGKMHLGHAFSYAQADMIARYKRMRGFEVFYPFGFDDNGLATERMVEKNRNIQSKNFSREDFIKICFEETRAAEYELKKDFSSLGLSVDWSLLYRTIDSYCRKQAQRSFIEIFGQNRTYQMEAPAMYCTKCETAIAQAELEDEEISSTFNDIAFETESGEKIIIATTRPELLGACVAVFVHPGDERNKRLVGKKLKVPLFGNFVQVKADERVDMSKGTGIVMCCTFGDQTDIEWFKAHRLPLKMVISLDGKINENCPQYQGLNVKKAREQILADLKEKGLLLKQMPIKHSVNVHERCKTEVEFLVTKQWFVKYLDLKKEFIEKAKEISWFPEHMRTRYDNWINGLQWDWCISRQRYFGVPFPIWYCKKCGKTIVAEEKQLPVDPLQHKPLKACSCGSNDFSGEKDVFDTWFTSSLTPEINCRWKENVSLFKKLFPMSLRPQAHDIITLWAFNTIVKAHFHANKIPWNNIMISGHALDSKGRKMSKSLGNVIAPQEMVSKYSADVLRYWSASASLGEDVPFQEKEMVSGQKFLIKLSNASNFVAMQSQNFDFGKANSSKLNFTAMDKWILSRINSLKKNATESLEKFEFSKGLNPVRDFFWLEFADYYLEEAKHRFYEKNDTTEAAQFTLVYVLTDCLKLLAPFLPHACEEIMQSNFKNLLKSKSIHLEQWPAVEEKWIDVEAEQIGENANAIISAIRKFKNSKGIALNRELEKVSVFAGGKILEKLEIAKIEIRKTLNIKELEFSNASPPENSLAANSDIKIAIL